MAFILVQAGSNLYRVDPTTGTSTLLTLPSGITLSTTRKPRFAVLNNWTIMVNSPTRNICVDPEGVVRVLVPRPPQSPPQVAAGAGTGLTGAYKFMESFYVKDSDGQLLMESPLSPASSPLTLNNQDAALTNIAKSQDAVTGTRIYRNGASGTQFYQLIDLEGNVQTSVNTNLADAALGLLPVQRTSLQSPPGTLSGTRLKTITAWKNRLWGVSDEASSLDTIFYTDDGLVYAWGFNLTAYPKGQDALGVVAFAPRRDELGILKRNGLWQITGNSNEDFAIVQIAFDKGGCVSQDSVVSINDHVYWLGKDGVYEWGPDGVESITDDSVQPWFTSDTYFNRARFPNTFGRYNEITNSYELHTAAVGSSNEDRWVSFNLDNRKWYGPHKTAAFTPTHSGYGKDANGLPICLIGGSDGVLYTANNTTKTDGSASAIDFDVVGTFHHGDAPDVEHYWGLLSILSRVQTAGTLTVTPTLGRLNASTVAQEPISHDMTKGRQLLRRLGDGAMVQLRFRENTVAQDVSLYGYTLPFFENARR